ncbi:MULTISPECIES: hypothetical protein [unclassified Sutcliffiella]|jgi:NhaP-type Na+/H+ or K+/H+ antiporter
MKKRLVLVAAVVFLLFGGAMELQKSEIQTQPDVISTTNKDEYPEIIPGG